MVRMQEVFVFREMHTEGLRWTPFSAQVEEVD
jgi:hypothetical protein